MFIGNQIIDCGGLDLTSIGTPQTITGLHSKLSRALKKDVNIILKNCVYGDPKSKVSAFNVMAYQYNGLSNETVFVFAGTLLIQITNEDSVSVSSMIPETDGDDEGEGGGFPEGE